MAVSGRAVSTATFTEEEVKEASTSRQMQTPHTG